METLWRRLPLLLEHLWGGVCPAKPPKRDQGEQTVLPQVASPPGSAQEAQG